MARLISTITDPAYQAHRILHLVFTAAPIVAGLDKFFNVLVEWDQYLWPGIPRRLPISGDTFMLLVGAIEIILGLIVALNPRLGGYLVMLWLWAISLNLFLIPDYYDIALRDFALSLGALALAKLSEARQRSGRVEEGLREQIRDIQSRPYEPPKPRAFLGRRRPR
jgi:hypothetical protein